MDNHVPYIPSNYQSSIRTARNIKASKRPRGKAMIQSKAETGSTFQSISTREYAFLWLTGMMAPCFFPQGVYYHRKSLQNRMLRSDYKWTLKRHMLQYVGLSKKYGEDKATQIIKNRWHWSQGQYRNFREKFEMLGIQPVPLRKNFHGDTLLPLGTWLRCLLGEGGK